MVPHSAEARVSLTFQNEFAETTSGFLKKALARASLKGKRGGWERERAGPYPPLPPHGVLPILRPIQFCGARREGGGTIQSTADVGTAVALVGDGGAERAGPDDRLVLPRAAGLVEVLLAAPALDGLRPLRAGVTVD